MAAAPLAGCGGDSGQSPVTPAPSPAPTPTPTPSPTPFTGPSLTMLAARKGRRFGSTIASWPGQPDTGSVQNSAYAALVKAECGLVVPENEMKWQTIRPDALTYDFTRMDQIVSWARTNGLALRATPLLWHRPEWFPAWLNSYNFGAQPAVEAARILTDHIRTVTRRYPAIGSWDVVNEAIDSGRNAPIQTSLSRAMGSPEAVLDLAFRTARQELPGAQLVYNDYMSWEPQSRAHCDAVLALLTGFRQRGTPVDALGIQSHIAINSINPATGVGPYDEANWRGFLDQVAAMGYRLVITEFDVRDRALPAATAQRDAGVADYARRYLDVMLDYDAHLDDILAWGMVDRYSWLQSYFPRPDGLEVRGTPYDSSYKPKPLRDAIAASLIAA